MRRRLIRIALILLLFPPFLAALAGWLVGPAYLHPIRRELTPDLIREADASFVASGGHREDFNVRAPDGVMLRGWKVSAPQPNGSWVLLFHGVADNRVGVIGQSEFLLRAGYGVVMMDARAHGASEGPAATYGWLERNDTRAIIDALFYSEQHKYITRQMSINPDLPIVPRPAFHLFALGESMGAGIALQSAAADPRIEAVVAEASFASPRPIRASKQSSPKRLSQAFAKQLTITLGSENIPGSEKLSSRLSVGRCSTTTKNSRAFPSRKFRRKRPSPPARFPFSSFVMKRMSPCLAAIRK